MGLSKSSKEILSLLNGCECQSLNYEGCVFIKGSEVWMNGEIVDTLNTDDKVYNIWAEYCDGEGL